MKSRGLLLAFLLAFPTTAYAAPNQPAADILKIQTLIERFRASIINKDKVGFLDLFTQGEVTWQSVETKRHLNGISASPDSDEKGFPTRRKTHLTFIDEIVASPIRKEEKFRDIQISTDGSIASVFFDYSFHSDGRKVNQGKEAWHLINTGSSWKIVSVIYSINRTPPP